MEDGVGISAAEDAESVQTADLRTPPPIDDLGVDGLTLAANAVEDGVSQLTCSPT